MNCKHVLALGGALTVAAAMPAVAGATKATVRVEGKTKTLLSTTTVQTHSGSVKIAGRSCASGSAVAVALATHNAWAGKWFSFGFEVTKILGETDSYTSTNSYWELFVDNVASQSGICDVALHPGEQILFAAVPASGTDYPLELSAPSHAGRSRAFTVTVKGFDAEGKAKPLAGATVDGQRTGSHGTATITLTHAGKTTLTASAKGYIRAEAQVRIA
jgi:hypothetical protein